jgi:hypothetical protein
MDRPYFAFGISPSGWAQIVLTETKGNPWYHQGSGGRINFQAA